MPLREFDFGRLARYFRGPRRHNDRRVGMMLGDRGLNAELLVCAVSDERRYLVEQGGSSTNVVNLLGRLSRRDNLAGVGVHADVQLLPKVANFSAVSSQMPLARPAEFEARAFHKQVQRLVSFCGRGQGTLSVPGWRLKAVWSGAGKVISSRRITDAIKISVWRSAIRQLYLVRPRRLGKVGQANAGSFYIQVRVAR